ncbi:amyloid fiber anchoring/assembly protein TapA [Tenuibacillus multivorans]|uniref:YqxM protein n=1 Tax=Tenuibacillus multivorans TaxID=237069 RepID=A0A1G9WV34_9BACI|nr:amyloid fiber anchoring/assembly protein TapA [Tenuibacillus multivorans]GEL78413.1 hypothetical protein TMU01_26480 [Tenuibacillus multivorans]SDM88338.1 YqxM protein [Tenuibacillus multivorans]
MRRGRLTERRKKELRRNLYIKPLISIYLFFLILSLMVGSTNAAFNDIEDISSSLHVKWELSEDELPDEPGEWDKSSLDFDGMGSGGSCTGIWAEVRNSGDGDMLSPWKYHVIKISKGNNGDVIFEGDIPLLKSGESTNLEYNGSLENGKYKFRFIRPEGHPGGDNGGYSNSIQVKDCAEAPSDVEEGQDATGDEGGNEENDNKDNECGNNGQGNGNGQCNGNGNGNGKNNDNGQGNGSDNNGNGQENSNDGDESLNNGNENPSPDKEVQNEDLENGENKEHETPEENTSDENEPSEETSSEEQINEENNTEQEEDAPKSEETNTSENESSGPEKDRQPTPDGEAVKENTQENTDESEQKVGGKDEGQTD